MDLPALHSRLVERSPVHYSWVILAAATLGLAMTTPGQTAGVSVFIDKIIADLGLSRSAVSLAYTIGTLAGAGALPFVGRAIDRRGPRVAVVVIAGLFALACVFMGWGVRGPLTLVVGFVLIRMLGQGSLSLVSLYVVNLWFVRRRGFAVGLLGIGMAVATAFFPLLLEGLIGGLGWRAAYAVLGLAVALTVLPVGALFYREKPERFGLSPDGDRSPPSGGDREAALTLAQARRTAVFWLFLGGDVLMAALSTGLVFHHYAIVAGSGLDRVEAATVFLFLGGLTAAANFIAGVLLDRIAPRLLLAAMMLFLAAALALAGAGLAGLLPVYGGLLGLAMGVKGALSGAVYAYYFGRASLGSIKGFATTLSVAGTALGPLLFSLGFDAFEAVGPVLLLSLPPCLALGLAGLAYRPRLGRAASAGD